MIAREPGSVVAVLGGLLTLAACSPVEDAHTPQENAIQASDLQHHRWIIAPAKAAAGAPAGDFILSLDFGERLFVTASTDCWQTSGFAQLKNNELTLPLAPPQEKPCEENRSDMTAKELTAAPWQVHFPTPNTLLLKRNGQELNLTLSDWR
jgi:heat shock protein HslJ